MVGDEVFSWGDFINLERPEGGRGLEGVAVRLSRGQVEMSCFFNIEYHIVSQLSTSGRPPPSKRGDNPM